MAPSPLSAPSTRPSTLAIIKRPGERLWLSRRRVPAYGRLGHRYVRPPPEELFQLLSLEDPDPVPPRVDARLGCQVQITKPGKVVVEIPAWNRNYVSEEH